MGMILLHMPPIFVQTKTFLKKRYVYIVCFEVMEHFYNPAKEFGLLKSLLLPNGTLYCKTKLYNSMINFTTWWYKNDPTHVFFYSNSTLLWIKNPWQKHLTF
ncbi:methyltransferase domain-containing protein [Aquimarina sp. 2201CG1-2-11]|uniref:methyltransferase domain-containing protein n=1 Tax=Aquimarina discodermiae TaxID=3231043 RepID=UPI003463822D